MSPNPNQRQIAVIVNGVAAVVTVNENAPLRTLVVEAIRVTDQERGHPPNDWEVKLAGAALDLDKKIEDFGFPDDVKLHVELRAGGGG